MNKWPKLFLTRICQQKILIKFCFPLYSLNKSDERKKIVIERSKQDTDLSAEEVRSEIIIFIINILDSFKRGPKWKKCIICGFQ